MTKELRKRLEEAARDYAETAVVIQSVLREEYIKESMHDFKTGASYGYKEAITQAKEWLKENYHLFDHFDKDEVISDFEADMNKLWEELK